MVEIGRLDLRTCPGIFSILACPGHSAHPAKCLTAPAVEDGPGLGCSGGGEIICAGLFPEGSPQTSATGSLVSLSSGLPCSVSIYKHVKIAAPAC
jgi:hypothetical protein